MFQRDYILRIIEQFGQALAKLVALKREEKFAEASAELEEAAKLLCGTPTKDLLATPLEANLQLLSFEDKLDTLRTAALARLFKERGDLAAQTKSGDPKANYVRAFLLYDEVIDREDAQALQDHQETVEWLAQYLQAGV